MSTSTLRITKDSGLPSWTIVDRSPSAYSQLSAAASALVKDESLSDDTLLERARGHLKVLELPQFAHLNAPLASHFPVLKSQLERIPAVTAGRFFDALIQTADDLDLGIGRRFPPAEICACVQLLTPLGGGDPPSSHLAKELSALLFRVWWEALNLPFINLSRDFLNPYGGDFPRHLTVNPVLRRDDYTCFMTGIVDKRAGCIRRIAAEKTGTLDMAPIFTEHFFIDPTHAPQIPLERLEPDSLAGNNYRSLQFLRTFGQITYDEIVPVPVPYNCLLLEHNAHLAFRLCKWTLVATEVPNRYKIRTYASTEQCLGTAHVNDYVTFAPRPDNDWAWILPDPSALRAHAILANVRHITGLGAVLDPEYWAPELIPGVMDIIRPPIPAGSARKWRVCRWLREHYLAHKRRSVFDEIVPEKVAAADDWLEPSQRLTMTGSTILL